MANASRPVALAVLLTMAMTVGCDRITKQMASSALAGQPGQSFLADTVRLAYVENTGGFLSLGADLPPVLRTVVFTGATGLLLLGLGVFALRVQHAAWPAFGLALFVGGGLSNWFDRVMRGSVVDFMNVGIGPLRTGVFNVADMAIMFGAGVFIISELHRHPHEKVP